MLQRQWVALVARRFRPDTIWVTHPSLMDSIPRRLTKCPIFYDCMDDALAMASDENETAQLAQLEQRLVRCSTRILCSSAYLGEVLAHRYTCDVREKLSVVRNAVSTKFLASSFGTRDQTKPIAGRCCKIAYFGTVAEWLDLDILLTCLAHRPNVEFHLIGPATLASPPRHERLHYHGAIPHDTLWEYVDQFDAFLVPFQVTPLIRAVDPVKLYEYLALGKEVISVQYPEIDRFGEFVHFYKTRSEFIQLVGDLAAGKLRDKNRPEVTRAFLEGNTWQTRVAQVCELLYSLN
jgi:glycosyltransferase involved in cell wall biosynthesis